ncbi:hypothetical protein LWC35_20920 [Pseudonocardia kujensis]|uniref:hypothetical protein n=1 Tax=Pseudonocardia kujensis TaxID=1128675 RepID=UPI001E3B3FC8|nr:hypothetical protein [Pseudonocardia kujensis]MCE0765345.1 hypothetical protein [Pseudonocardia kujensis]
MATRTTVVRGAGGRVVARVVGAATGAAATATGVVGAGVVVVGTGVVVVGAGPVVGAVAYDTGVAVEEPHPATSRAPARTGRRRRRERITDRGSSDPDRVQRRRGDLRQD